MSSSQNPREGRPGEARFTCVGHPAIRATHAKTLELTRDPEISARGTCIAGVAATYEPRRLARLRGRLRLTLAVGGASDTLVAEAAAFPETTRSLIFRRSPVEQPRTFARGADKGASGLDRGLIAELSRPGALIEVTVREMGATSPGALALVPCEAQAGSPGLGAVLLAADGIASRDREPLRAWGQGLAPRPAFAGCGRGADVLALLARLAAGERWVLAVAPGDLAAGQAPQELVAAALAQGAHVVAVGPVPAWQRALWVSGFAAEPVVWLGPAPRPAALVATLERQGDPRAAVVTSMKVRELPPLLDLLATRLPERRFATRVAPRGRLDEEAYVVFAPADAAASAELPETVELASLLAAGVPLKLLAAALAPRYGGAARRAYQALLTRIREREEEGA